MVKISSSKSQLHNTKIYKTKGSSIELPEDFDWKIYLELNPDVKKQGFTTERLVCEHYEKWGKKENRPYNSENFLDTQQIKQTKQPDRYDITPESTLSLTKEITIVIPNKQGQIPDVTIKSLYKQTFVNFDIIIINDIEGNANKARNVGLKLVKTPYVLFSDNDINWEPNAIQNMYNCLEKNPNISIAYGSYEIGNKLLSNHKWDETLLKKRNYISTMSLVRTVDHPGFDESILRLQDWDVWLTMLDNGKKGKFINKKIFSTKIRKGITTNSISFHTASSIVTSKHANDIDKLPISIMITAYKSQDFIEECLDSIENQNYFINNNNFEVLVGVDNCEDTLNKLNEIKHKYKNLKIIMLSKNVGTYITTNTLLNYIQYSNVIRFDSDDIMKHTMISDIFKYINSADVIRLGYNNFKDNIKYVAPRDNIAHGVIFFKRFVLDDIAGGFQPWKCGADTELISRIKGKVKIVELKSMFYRRQHENNLTNHPETGFKSEIRKKYVSKIKNHYNDNEIKIERVTGELK